MDTSCPLPPSSTKSNKIRDIVRLQQLLKKWRKTANAKKSTTSSTHSTPSSSGSKSIKFLKKTLSFSDISSSLTYCNGAAVPVPKGYMAVCVGIQEKRVVIPTEYLSHPLFGMLLREAEEEFGFQQQGVLKLPCDVDLFDQVLLKMMENDDDKNPIMKHASVNNNCSPDAQLTSSSHHHSHTQLCN